MPEAPRIHIYLHLSYLVRPSKPLNKSTSQVPLPQRSKPCSDICSYSPEEQHQLRGLGHQRGDRIVHALTVEYFEAILEMYTWISGPY